jgi:hypothetical protein
MNVLVVIVESRGVEALIPEILSVAKPGFPVTLLQLRDANYAGKVCNKLTQEGWLGAYNTEEVGRAVSEDYESRFNEACRILRQELNVHGIETLGLTRDGALVNTVLKIAEETEDLGLIILGKPVRNWLTRWFKDFNVRLLVERAPVELRVIPLGLE